MSNAKSVIFPAGTPVLILGLQDSSVDALEAFAYNDRILARGYDLECGLLAEPFVTGGAVLISRDGETVGIKPLPEDRLRLIELADGERVVSINRSKPDEFGKRSYLVAADTRGIARSVSGARGFMCGYEPRMRIGEEFKRIIRAMRDLGA